ncbi:MAG: polysaccharide deacetylase family protein [Candidatus Latescibacterota bacterium]|nr:polysaccharide deacetylase family protein [Candidatus Latescibacterota bacterium]
MNTFWPDKIEGAVSLTFDDGIVTQLDNATPCLNENGMKGTFYLNPNRGERWDDLLTRWKEVSKQGHEIGNHTCSHPCSCNFGFSTDNCLEKLTIEDIRETIDKATEVMNAEFPEQNGRRSFCYPCYQSHVGSGVNRQSYVPLVAERFVCGRGGGERANNPELTDLSYAWAWAVNGHSGQDMINYIEDAVSQGRWAIICMHGVGGEHIAIETEALNETCVYLHGNQNRILTNTVIAIADYIVSRREELDIVAL